LPKSAERVHSDALPVLHMGKEVGLRISLIGRPTAEEAYASASICFPRVRREGWDGSVERAPWLLTEAVGDGYPWGVALVGSFEDLAKALMRYRENGISQFLLSGPADGLEMMYFGEGVLPLVRRLERELSK